MMQLKLLLHHFSFITILTVYACAPNNALRYADNFESKQLTANKEQKIKVLFNGTWKNSGVEIKKGETYLISATGKWRHNPNCNFTGPDGFGMYATFCRDIPPWNQYRILEGFPQSALIAKIETQYGQKKYLQLVKKLKLKRTRMVLYISIPIIPMNGLVIMPKQAT